MTRRVVGMSATLPNYEDIAAFLRVPPEHTYYFGREYRHVPLQQIFYGYFYTLPIILLIYLGIYYVYV